MSQKLTERMGKLHAASPVRITFDRIDACHGINADAVTHTLLHYEQRLYAVSGAERRLLELVWCVESVLIDTVGACAIAVCVTIVQYEHYRAHTPRRVFTLALCPPLLLPY